jgi:hypothetical protein
VIRGARFATLILLTLLQMRALLGAIAPVFGLTRRLADQEERARVRSGLPEPRPSGPQREPASASRP